MESKQEEEKDTVTTEVTQAEDTSMANTGPPTLDEMLKNPLVLRRYVTMLADQTPQAPPDLYGDAFRNWQYHHLLTATLNHLLAVFKHYDDPKQHAFWYYDANLKVNNTDYKASPFMPFASVEALFKHEAKGRRECVKMARAAAGLAVLKQQQQRERKSLGGGGRKKKNNAVGTKGGRVRKSSMLG
ncbi:MAG: hypothetical protein ASARMPREDX12_005362 [Alectoria sarmentosa]|nr:MAG: hypothetical protein ASARMPREDX12_005362 [Alectoria sarmentosa]